MPSTPDRRNLTPNRRIPDDPIVASLGLRLAFLRRRARLTQLQLAAKSGIDRSFLSDIERGIRTASVVTINTIAQTYGITLAELFDGVETL